MNKRLAKRNKTGAKSMACAERRAFVGGPVRRIVERLAWAVMAVLVMRTWFCEGLFVPYQVTSGSMADTLWGVHRELRCLDCGHRFACGADLRPLRRWAVCPNCGFARNSLRAVPDTAGDRLLIGKSIFSLRCPRRWELVAFRHPQRAAEICLKRVVGLPGESIQIRHGDVYVNGRLARKTLAQQRAVAILVHEAACASRLTDGLPPRWRALSRKTGWAQVDGKLVYHPSLSAKAVDWLVYCHWRRLPGATGEVYAAPILNYRGYNQTRPHRAENLHPVADLLVSFRLVRTWSRGRLLVRASDGRCHFQAVIEPAQNRYAVFREAGRTVPLAWGKLPKRGGQLYVEVSLFDRQFLLALDGRPTVVWPYKAGDPQPRPTSRPLAIGSQGLGLEIEDLRVWRDVYYTCPAGQQGRWGLSRPVQLGPDQYFVLGDNSPVSEDSRSWPAGPAVPANLLVGKPFLVHFPARAVRLGRWHFQVPDPARMRYIR